MKWLLVLFAMYMLLLPCIPCNAGEACCASDEVSCQHAGDCASDEMPCEHEGDCASDETPCQHEGEGTPENHHEHSPICPCCPSFSCNTCHSLVISAHFVLEEPSIPVLNFDNISFADEPLTSFAALIWQPPRVFC